MLLPISLRDKKGQGHNALYVRLRNDADYWNFTSRIWSTVETVDTKKFLHEKIDRSPSESRYATTIDIPKGLYVLEVVVDATGEVIGEDVTTSTTYITLAEIENSNVLAKESTVARKLDAASYNNPDNGALYEIKTRVDNLPTLDNIEGSNRLAKEATVLTRMSQGTYIAPDNTSIGLIWQKTQYLPPDPASNANVTSRLAKSDYILPDNVSVSLIKNTVAFLPTLAQIETSSLAKEATVARKLDASSYVAPDNASINTIKSRVSRLPDDPASDTTVKTRMAQSSYVAPDNAGIANASTLLNSLHAKSDEIREKTQTILNIDTGNWEIKNNHMIFYDQNGNEFMKFELLDKDGLPSEANVFRRRKV